MPESPIESQIIILDDDAWPDGRITRQVLPEFKKRGLGKYVHHYPTFTELKEDLESGKLSKNNLFVLDSSIQEPSGQRFSFENTVPWLLDHGIKTRRMMPGSSWDYKNTGVKNNLWFEEFVRRRGRTIRLNQMALFHSGLAGNPESVVNGILAYYKELYPGKIQKETEGNSCAPEALSYWKYRNSHER